MQRQLWPLYSDLAGSGGLSIWRCGCVGPGPRALCVRLCGPGGFRQAHLQQPVLLHQVGLQLLRDVHHLPTRSDAWVGGVFAGIA